MNKRRSKMIPNLTVREEIGAARRDFAWFVRLQVARVRRELQVELRRAEWLRRRSQRLINEGRRGVATPPEPPPRRSHPTSIARSRRLRLVK